MESEAKVTDWAKADGILEPLPESREEIAKIIESTLKWTGCTVEYNNDRGTIVIKNKWGRQLFLIWKDHSSKKLGNTLVFESTVNGEKIEIWWGNDRYTLNWNSYKIWFGRVTDKYQVLPDTWSVFAVRTIEDSGTKKTYFQYTFSWAEAETMPDPENPEKKILLWIEVWGKRLTLKQIYRWYTPDHRGLLESSWYTLQSDWFIKRKDWKDIRLQSGSTMSSIEVFQNNSISNIKVSGDNVIIYSWRTEFTIPVVK